jgi:hypothetical protein
MMFYLLEQMFMGATSVTPFVEYATIAGALSMVEQ